MLEGNKTFSLRVVLPRIDNKRDDTVNIYDLRAGEKPRMKAEDLYLR